MYLKRLELQGFKSFAHKTVLDFEPGMTAVVGPNGSGKSNVSDGLRWVMGEQSLKLLRGKKSEDVIFAGSDKRSKLSFAEVSLTFDNRDHKIPLEYSEVVISRRLYRNGEGEYLINNQRVRLLDVVDALMRSGFGATNYAVIGQGTIDQMILAGPAEIKNLVEEASGVKPYYLKREKTFRKLEQTAENLSRVSELLAEIEPRLRSLKRQAKRMEEREAIAAELSGLQLEYFGNGIYLIETELKTITDRLSLKSGSIQQLEMEIGTFQKTLEKEEQQSKSSTSFSEELNKKISDLEDRRFALTEQLANIRGQLKSELVPGQIDTKSLSVDKLEFERQIEITRQKLKTINQNLSDAEKNLGEIRKKLSTEQLSNKLMEFEQDFERLLVLLRPENIEEIKSKMRGLIQDLVSVKNTSSKEDLLGQIHELELKVVENSAHKQNYENNIAIWTNKLNQIKTMLQENPEQFKHELFKQEESLNQELGGIIKQMDELKLSQAKLLAEEKQKKTFLTEEEKKFRVKSAELARLKDEQNLVLIEKAKLDTRLESLHKEIKDAFGGVVPETLSQHKKAQTSPDLPNKVMRLKHQLELAGGVDEATLMEYHETQERFDYLTTQLADLTQAATDLRSVIEELDQIIKKQFDEAFEKISNKFSEYFRILFNGGQARMTLLKESQTDEDEEVAEEDEVEKVGIDGVKKKKAAAQIVGIDIKATPPGKKLASIAALSGGERALTAIALLCSMLASYPSPFVVLDEVDAALDEANSIRFAKILGTLAHQTQFITITHNRETMRQAHTLYGVTMSDEGISKILSIKLDKAEELVR